MKLNFLMSLILFSSFSVNSHAAKLNPLTWLDWEKPQNIDTAVDKKIFLSEEVELNKFITDSTPVMTNSRSLLVDGNLTIDEDYYPEESDNEFYCGLNFYSTDVNMLSIGKDDTELFIVDTLGNRGRNWKEGKFSWVSASFSNKSETITGNIICSRVNSKKAIGYVPFIKMIRPLIKLQ